MSAREGVVAADRPKNGTKTASRGSTFWSTKIATVSFRAIARRSSFAACLFEIGRFPNRRRSFESSSSRSGLSSGRATGAIGSPRSPATSAPTSQLPKCAERRKTPFPRDRAARRFSSPSTATRERSSSRERRPVWRKSTRALAKPSIERRAMDAIRPAGSSGKAAVRLSRRIFRRERRNENTIRAAARPARRAAAGGSRASPPAAARKRASSARSRRADRRRLRDLCAVVAGKVACPARSAAPRDAFTSAAPMQFAVSRAHPKFGRAGRERIPVPPPRRRAAP